MKIAIAELETQTEILDLDYTKAGTIIGGGTFGSTSIEVGANGEVTFADAETFSLTFKIPYGQGKTGSLTVTGGLGIAADFPLGGA